MLRLKAAPKPLTYPLWTVNPLALRRVEFELELALLELNQHAMPGNGKGMIAYDD